jgi:hypothetical protein
MAIIKNKSTDENRQFWSHVEAVANEVRTWPQWMGNRDVRLVRDDTEREQPKSTDTKVANTE